MDNIFYFALNHPVVSLFMCWSIVGAIRAIVVRMLRLVMVACRGWPPAHLDADGDWKPATEETK